MDLNAPLDWNLDSYTEIFRADTTPHRDARHALLHVLKAAGKISQQLEPLDHPNPPPAEDMGKFLADLIISAVRIGQTAPGGPIDLEQAVAARLKRNTAAHPPAGDV